MTEANLLKNGDFTEGEKYWRAVAGEGQIATVENGHARIGRGGQLEQDVRIGLTVGKLYRVQGEFTSINGGTGKLRILENGAVKEVDIDKSGTFSRDFIFERSSTEVLIALQSTTQERGEIHADNLTLVEQL